MYSKAVDVVINVILFYLLETNSEEKSEIDLVEETVEEKSCVEGEEEDIVIAAVVSYPAWLCGVWVVNSLYR